MLKENNKEHVHKYGTLSQASRVTSLVEARRTGSRAPHAPASQGLQALMEKLGRINERHEALVKRVDDLEVRHVEIFVCENNRSTGTSMNNNFFLRELCSTH